MENSNIQPCYPVLIATLHRYEHFVRCVESLQRNPLAKETELIIGVDYPPSEKYLEGNHRIKKYIHTIKGFGKVTIFERDTNLGAVRNFASLYQYAYAKYRAIIVTEDDNVFSPNFLYFMNQALRNYEQDERITSVSAYNYPNMYNQNGYNAFLRPVSVEFGIGFWKEKSDNIIINDLNYYEATLKSVKKSMKIIFTSLAEMRMLLKMVKNGTIWGDVGRSIKNINENKYQLAPSVSLVRNCGYDGSGEHCGKDEHYTNQIIDTNDQFIFNGVNSPKTLANKWNNFVCMMPRRRFMSVFVYLIYTIKYYFDFRFNVKEAE